MKKVILIILLIISVLGIGGYVGFRYFLSTFGDQVALQYDKTPETPYKLSLNTAPFMDEANYEKQVNWLPHADIKTIQEKLMKREITLEALVKFYGTRIAKMDSNYNSVIRLNEKAVEEAILQDRAIEEGQDLKPLTGVVILVKDNIATYGMGTSAGSYALKDLYTKRHAFLVNTLIEDGAIVLGKTNLSEFSNFMSLPSSSGFSTLGGQTYNAFGKFDVGGSSSGSSVASSLGFATVTLGTETAGSLIFPAGQNGVVAIKPTMGLLSRDLIIPISEAQDTAGVIGQNVSDVHHVFLSALKKDKKDAMSHYHDDLSQEDLTRRLEKDALKGKKLAFIDDGTSEMAQIKVELEKLGAELVLVPFPEKASEIDMETVLLYGIVNDMNAFLSNEAVVSPLKDLEAIVAFNQEDATRAPFGQFYFERALSQKIDKDLYERTVQKNYDVSIGIIEDILKSTGAEAIVSLSNGLSGIYAPARCPAVTVPSGTKASGEPYGVTFVGGLCSDIKLLNLAYAYEQGR